MAIRKIRFIGDPCLNKVCKPVQKITPSIETLIEDMFDTMYEARGDWFSSTTDRNFKKNLCH